MKSWKRFLQTDKTKFIFCMTAILFVIAVLCSLCLGVAELSILQLIKAMKEGAGSSFEGNIFWYVRVPRTAACVFAGMGLAVSGAVIQGVLANKLASSGILGINAGAGLAVTICCAFGVLSGWMIAGCAFLGALLTVIFIALMAEKTGASRTTVILGGVVVNSMLNACTETIITLVPEVGAVSADFRVGGFTSVVGARVFPAGCLIILGTLFLCTLCNELDLMTLGEDTAQGLGLSVKRMRSIFLFLAALLAGASVSFAGLLGFVGLIVPHIGRRLVGTESRYLLPFCALFGAAFVTICDLGARLIVQPYEIPTGIIMSFIGGPFFGLMLLKNKGGHRYG